MILIVTTEVECIVLIWKIFVCDNCHFTR